MTSVPIGSKVSRGSAARFFWRSVYLREAALDIGVKSCTTQREARPTPSDQSPTVNSLQVHCLPRAASTNLKAERLAFRRRSQVSEIDDARSGPTIRASIGIAYETAPK